MNTIIQAIGGKRGAVLPGLVFLLLMAGAGHPGRADSFTNPVPDSDYATGGNWSGAVVPSGTAAAVIGDGAQVRSAVYGTPTGFTTSGAATLGTGPGSRGSLMLSGAAGTLIYAAMNVGASGGAGTLTVQAGALTAGDIVLATTGTGSSGAMTVAGGMATAERLIVGDAAEGTGVFTLSSGTMSVTGRGLYTVFGGGNASSNTVSTIHLNGGIMKTGRISEYTASVTSVLNLNGGLLQAAVADGNYLVADTINVLEGGARIDTNGNNITINKSFTAAAGNGGLVKSGAGTLGITSNSSGSPMNITVGPGGALNLAVGGLVYTNAGGVGNGGTLQVNAGGTLQLSVRYNLGYAQPLVINGGTVQIASGTPEDGVQYTENVHFTGGGTITGNAMRLGDVVGTGGTIRVSGPTPATIQTNIRLIGAPGKTGTFDVGATGAGGADLSVSGVVSDYAVAGLPIIKSGAGTLALNGDNTYTGTTTINEGTLLVNGTHTGGGLITASAGSTLGGDGRVGDVDIAAGAMLSPGVGIGHLHVGALTLHPDSILNFELGAPTPIQSAGSDFATITGVLTLGGVLNISPVAGFVSPSGGEKWRIMSAEGGIDNTHPIMIGSAPAPGPGLSYDVLLEGEGVYLVVVPETGSAALILIGGLFLRAWSGRRSMPCLPGSQGR